LIDLAGAERPEKAGYDRSSPTDILAKAYAGKPMETAE
jgi:hypothetical protein